MRAQVVLLRDDLILLARHQRGAAVYWVLPGGAVEPEESPQDAAIREVREETGLLIRLERQLFVDQPGVVGGVRISSPRYTFLGRIVGGELDVPDEAGNERNGRLVGVDWVKFDFSELDASTRDTLGRVRRALH